ncbi:MAG: hypothetical protein LBK63_02775 [Treponema sp.]|jgi:hypothetical protein|nr:hypothetical protein [Treponema sp.]
MKYLLFGGAPAVGKSETITRLKEFLESKGIATSEEPVSINEKGDFYAYLDGTNAAGAKVRVLVSSATDAIPEIQGFKSYCDSHEPYDIVISPIRDTGDPERANFFSIMGKPHPDSVVEIPMGKITKKNGYDQAIGWYRNAIDTLAHRVLSNAPFQLLSINDIQT